MTVPTVPQFPSDLRSRRDDPNNRVPTPNQDWRRQEVAREGEFLLNVFVDSELRSRDLAPLCPLDLPLSQSSGWSRDKDDLRAIATEFSTSSGRRRARRAAESVSLETLTAPEFRSMCDELFAPPAGVTRERIIVLFFFLADLASLAVTSHLYSAYTNVMRWSVDYVRDRVSTWVVDNGGWGRVLDRSSSLALKMCGIVTLCLISAAACVYLWKRA